MSKKKFIAHFSKLFYCVKQIKNLLSIFFLTSINSNIAEGRSLGHLTKFQKDKFKYTHCGTRSFADWNCHSYTTYKKCIFEYTTPNSVQF